MFLFYIYLEETFAICYYYFIALMYFSLAYLSKYDKYDYNDDSLDYCYAGADNNSETFLPSLSDP